jgi:hypothetical protein
MASQKVPPCGVTASFQDIDILAYVLAPEKPPSLAGRNFCLAILGKASIWRI